MGRYVEDASGKVNVLICASSDPLLSPHNLNLWHSLDEACLLCSSQNKSLKHILEWCNAVLMQGRYRRCHDWVLDELAELLETHRLEVNAVRPVPNWWWIQFLRQRSEVHNIGMTYPSLQQTRRTLLATAEAPLK